MASDGDDDDQAGERDDWWVDDDESEFEFVHSGDREVCPSCGMEWDDEVLDGLGDEVECFECGYVGAVDDDGELSGYAPS